MLLAADYVFDDRGANTNGTPGGDRAYPAAGAPYHGNGADLVELRVAASAGGASALVGVG
jgi:hypothetical protein